METKLIADVVILEGKRVFLVRAVVEDYFFFPGLAVSFTPGFEESMKRELEEKFDVQLISATFIGVAENLFSSDSVAVHQPHFVFSGKIGSYQGASPDGAVRYNWVPVSEIERIDVRPKPVARAIAQWGKDGKVFCQAVL